MIIIKTWEQKKQERNDQTAEQKKTVEILEIAEQKIRKGNIKLKQLSRKNTVGNIETAEKNKQERKY